MCTYFYYLHKRQNTLSVSFTSFILSQFDPSSNNVFSNLPKLQFFIGFVIPGGCGMVIPLDLVQLNTAKTDLADGHDIYFAEVFWTLQRH